MSNIMMPLCLGKLVPDTRRDTARRGSRPGRGSGRRGHQGRRRAAGAEAAAAAAAAAAVRRRG